MKIEINPNFCVGCAKYTQYFAKDYNGEYQPINCGYCGQRQIRTRPGNRCKAYRGQGTIQIPIRMNRKAEAKA